MFEAIASERTRLAGQGLALATVDALCPEMEARLHAVEILASCDSVEKDVSKGRLVAIVGGGLSGCEAARLHAAEGASVIVLEKRIAYGGVWATTANTASRVQVDPVSFRPLHDSSPLPDDDESDPFGSFYRSRADVLDQLASDIEGANLIARTVFGVHVESFDHTDDGKVAVTVAVDDGTCAIAVFDELHIRTGSLTDHVGGATALGLDDVSFGGKVARGIADDVASSELADADVVIVGLGAFAVENVRRSLAAGAKSITVLTRRADKLLFPEAATYVLRHALNQTAAAELGQAQLDAMWARVHGLVATGAAAAGLSDLLLNPDTVVEIDGLPHFVFSNGLPAMSSNVVFLGAAYGLVTIFVDEIAAFASNGLVTKTGRELPADVVLTCLGFGTRDSLLAGHTVTDAWFVDGRVTVTHNLRGDRVNGANVIGPRVDASNFLISYYEDAVEYERTIRSMCDDESREIYHEIACMEPISTPAAVDDVDYFTTLVLSNKLERCSAPRIAAILDDNRDKRVALYDLVLPDWTFWERDAAAWDRMARELAGRVGKDVIPYPGWHWDNMLS
ncbi:uncharacterized protein AMSG_05019 [Thecamonas trahens ATCC 50062]|uniref:Uncharacterized protein n=1 Tax=Thecamonas trahens ATCC 50062 TaxID=461836 RepID=A0A0L0DA18_THETB|nr:hypothetical protein AMSG_05019 [Thecamonas trahens ATCC 50062]KNC49060.1 hypothetical protein AMSG_05019 [Thecamonas trahens ATCC 50062]|eukprot:XP_013758093.1 hypothetical protein AMSG_05019 [Thecamonas trahens ATCC 50062]